MVDLKPPTNVLQLQAQLGVFNFYRGYVPHFSSMAKPMYELLKKDRIFSWDDSCQQSYNGIKQAFLKPGLALSLPDPKQTLHLYTDWSKVGIAAILNQRDVNDNETMIGCVSRTLNAAEQNYHAYKGECLAAVYGAKAFRPYLLGVHYYHHTDAKPLLWLLTAKDYVSSQAMRWALLLSEYRFTIVHRPGVHNIADAPSRQPGACMADWAGARIDLDPLPIPVPSVVYSDGLPDTTSYTHEQLTLDLGIFDSKQQRPLSVANLAAAPLFSSMQPAALTPTAMLLQGWQPSSVSPSFSSSYPAQQHQLLFSLMANNETAVDTLLADSVSLLGGVRYPSILIQQTASHQLPGSRSIYSSWQTAV
jgi:hypothetical protein